MTKSLADVTVIAVTSVNLKETIATLESCRKALPFGAVKMISDRKWRGVEENGIIFERLGCHINLGGKLKLETIDDYSDYIFKHLHTHIETSHALLVQADSGIMHPDVWDNDWLDYDYIGAPWLYSQHSYICKETKEHVRVGNGGFSLRSKKLMELPSKIGMPLVQEQGFWSEDGNICVYHRVEMLKNGIKYAPIDVASKFSYENLMSANYKVRPFGWHKNHPIKTWEDNE